MTSDAFTILYVPAICILKDREPGAFVIRDSNSFRGAYGLAMKVASPPPMMQQINKGIITMCIVLIITEHNFVLIYLLFLL